MSTRGDAPTPKRRADDGNDERDKRRVDPLWVVFTSLILAGVIVIVIIARWQPVRVKGAGDDARGSAAGAVDGGASDSAAEDANDGAHDDAGQRALASKESSTSANARKQAQHVRDLASLAKKEPTTAKGKLMKEALTKRAAAASGSIDVALAGDAAVRRVFAQKLKGVHIVEESEHGFGLSLRTEKGKSGGGVYARCSAAISELPAHKLVASLSSRADVAGGGGDAELESDAADACVASLAEDVVAWMKAHR